MDDSDREKELLELTIRALRKKLESQNSEHEEILHTHEQLWSSEKIELRQNIQAMRAELDEKDNLSAMELSRNEQLWQREKEELYKTIASLRGKLEVLQDEKEIIRE